MQLPEIRAHLVHRFIFNYRVPPEVLAERLPEWLEPQVIRGLAVGSHCVLCLERVTFGPLPDRLGVSNINCAQRFGVIDKRTDEPAVYVHERNTDSRLGAFVSSLGFPGKHVYVKARVEESGEGAWSLEINNGGGEPLFSARAARTDSFSSSLFDSMGDFKEFLAAGVRSYSPAVKPDRLNVVDLEKEDPTYEPLSAEDVHDSFFESCSGVFDSALRTGGGTYRWSYRGHEALT